MLRCTSALKGRPPTSTDLPSFVFGQLAQCQLLQDLTALMVPHCETATDVSHLLHALGERARRSKQSVGPSNSASKLAMILDSPTNDFSYVTFSAQHPLLHSLAAVPYVANRLHGKRISANLCFSPVQRHEMRKGARKASSLRADLRSRA